jgi:hypothetical protein
MQVRLHIGALHRCASQWGINTVQFDGVDLPLAVFVLWDWNLSAFDRPQDRGLVPADPASADSLIQSINALELLLRPASEIKGKDDGAAN